MTCKPFVKWAGGKTQLLDRLKEQAPATYNTYYEPFVGGGAFLFALQPERAVINDTNEQLLNAYRQIKSNPDSVISVVKLLDSITANKDVYYELRDRYNEKISKQELDAECAGLMIWINKHCFNGLYRVNKNGLFNVPYNNKKSGASIDVENILNISHYLNDNDVTILQEDFEQACKDVSAGDFVYFDSPYIPVSETANFSDYTKDGFSMEDHFRLAETYKDLDKRGAKLMLSNHDVPMTFKLYADFNIVKVNVQRAINSDSSKRTGKEVIITNYE